MPDAVPPEGESQSLRRRAARGGAVTLVAQATKVVLSLASVVVLARLIAPSEFGLVVMVTAISSIALIFLDFGLSMSALRSKSLTQQQQSNLFWLNVASGIILAAAVFTLAAPIAKFYDQDLLVPLAQWLSLTYVLGGFTAQFRVHMNRAMRFEAIAIAEVLAPLIALAAAIVVAALGYGIAALIVQQLVTAAVILLLSAVLSRWRPSLPRRTPGMRSLLSFGGSFAATQLLSYVAQNADSIAIGRVWGPVQLGLYDRAFRLSVAPVTQINVPMTRIAMPVLSKVVDDSRRFVAALREAQLIACYVTSSALLVLGGLSVPLVHVLLGPEWSAAGPILGVLAVGATFRAIQQIGNWVLVSKGRGGSLLKFNLFAQPMIIAFILSGLPWGAMGVAVGGAVGYSIYWVMSLMWAARVTGLDLQPLMVNALRIVGTFSLPAGLLSFASTVVIPLGPLWQIAIGVAVSFSWFAIAYLISGSIRRDLKSLTHFAMLALGRR